MKSAKNHQKSRSTRENSCYCNVEMHREWVPVARKQEIHLQDQKQWTVPHSVSGYKRWGLSLQKTKMTLKSGKTPGV